MSNHSGTRDAGTTYLVRGSFRPGSDAVSRSVLELAISMQRAGRAVKIVSWTGPGVRHAERCGAGTVVALGDRAGSGGYTSADRLTFLLKAAGYLWRRARTGDAVVTLEDPTALGLAALPLRLRSGVRHYTYLMDLQSIQYLSLNHGGLRSAMVNRLRRQLDRLTWRSSDAVIVLGECMKDVVLGVQKRARVLVIPIWQDGQRIHPVDAAQVRQSMGMEGKLVVMYHGHATYRQPMNLVLDAARSFGRAGDPVHHHR